MKLFYSIRQVMATDVVTVKTSATLHEATRCMVDRDIGAVVAVQDGEMAGILTERDILKQLYFEPECANFRVADVMSSPLITVDQNAAIGQAADLMAKKKIRRLLVTEQDRIVGIVTERDLMRATLDVFRKLSDAWV